MCMFFQIAGLSLELEIMQAEQDKHVLGKFQFANQEDCELSEKRKITFIKGAELFFKLPFIPQSSWI